MQLGLMYGFYGLLTAGALLWGELRDTPGLFVHGPGRIGFGWGVLAGLGLGLATVAATRLTIRRWHRLRQLSLLLGELLGPLSTPAILLLAGVSSLAEELFFRGAMQPSWGLVLTALLFGLGHLGPDRRFLPYTLMGLGMGGLLGGLVWLTGNLVAPILAHFTINFFNLHLIEELRQTQPKDPVDELPGPC